MSDTPTLNPRQERFVQEYIKDFNGLQAAIRAGYSPKTARVQSSALLTKPDISQKIDDARQRAIQLLTMQSDEVVRNFTRIARFDVRKLFTEDQELKPIHELDDDTAYAIASIEVRTEVVKAKRGKPQRAKVFRIHRIKTHDKTAALQHLGRIHGIFRDKVEVNGTLSLEALVLGAIERGKLTAPQPAQDAPQQADSQLTIEGKAEEPC